MASPERRGQNNEELTKTLTVDETPSHACAWKIDQDSVARERPSAQFECSAKGAETAWLF